MEEEIANIFTAQEPLLQIFYRLLWQKTGADRFHTHTLTGINIPHTVILNHSRPIEWYFSSKDGDVKRKSRKNMATVKVVEEFCRTRKDTRTKYAAMLLTHTGSEEEDGVSTATIERKHLGPALTEELMTGTLQRFVEPKHCGAAMQNCCLRVNWTPNVTHIEKRINRLNLLDTHSHWTDADRTTLRETSPLVTTVPVIANRTTDEVERICQSIAVHIRALHSIALTNLVLHCRVDADDVLWVTHCTSLAVNTLEAPPRHFTLACFNREPKSEERTQLSDRGVAETPKSAADAPSGALTADPTCRLCLCPGKEGSMRKVSQRHLWFTLEVVDFFHSHPPGTVFVSSTGLKEKVVPSYIRILHPELRFDEYERLMKTSRWPNQSIPICDSCASGMEAMTANIAIQSDGRIVVPERSLLERSDPRSLSTVPSDARPLQLPIPNSRPATRAATADPSSASPDLKRKTSASSRPPTQAASSRPRILPNPATKVT